MSKTELTKQIENSIMMMKSKNDIYINEYTIKGDKFNLIYDAITLDMKTDMIIGYEVKVSTSDFNNLYRKLLDRDHNYDIYVDKFYICVPRSLEEYAIMKLKEWLEDIAYIKNIGLKVYDENTKQLKTKKSAIQNNRTLFNGYVKIGEIKNIKDYWIKKESK